jgi:hypothetical protein
MEQPNLFYVYYLQLPFVILTSSLAAAVFTPEAITISYQINNSARIVIGTVSKIDNYNDYKIID